MNYTDDRAERAVLGAVLIDNEALGIVRQIVRADSFGEPRNATVYTAMLALADAGRVIDAVTLGGALTDMKRLNTVGGAQFLGEITDRIEDVLPSPTHVEAHARLVAELAAARAAVVAARRIAIIATSGVSPRDLLAEMHKVAGEIPAGIEAAGKRYDGVTHAVAAWDSIIAAQGGTVQPARFGVRSLDGDRGHGEEGALGGMFPEQLVFLGGEPGAGKTTLADQAACETAATGRKVLVFPTEMSGPEIAKRRAATACGLSQARMRGGMLSQDELDAFGGELQRFSALPIETIDDVCSVEGIRARVLAEVAKGDIGLVVVDYFQMLTSTDEKGRDENRAEAKRWDAMKRVARDAKVPVLVVSSLTKGGQKNARDKGSPEQTDARGSGPEYACDVMVFLTCEHPEDSRREVIAHIKKNRQGPVGPVTLSFDTTHGRFEGAQAGYTDRTKPSKKALPKRNGNVVPLHAVADEERDDAAQ